MAIASHPVARYLPSAGVFRLYIYKTFLYKKILISNPVQLLVTVKHSPINGVNRIFCLISPRKVNYI